MGLEDLACEGVASAMPADTPAGCCPQRTSDGRDWANTLSTGEKQRLAVARVLLRAPELV